MISDSEEKGISVSPSQVSVISELTVVSGHVFPESCKQQGCVTTRKGGRSTGVAMLCTCSLCKCTKSRVVPSDGPQWTVGPICAIVHSAQLCVALITWKSYYTPVYPSKV